MADRVYSIQRAVETLDDIFEESQDLTRWHLLRAINTSSTDDYLRFVLMVMDLNAKLYIATELLRGAIK